MLATGDRRQRLGDMAARTSVVDAQAEHDADGVHMDAFDAAHMHAQTAPPRGPRSRRPSARAPASVARS